MKQSREYQASIENAIPHYLADYGSVIVQGPTGCGKSHIINKTVKKIIAAGKIPLVISDSAKIHKQLVRECNACRIDATTNFFMLLDGYPYVAMAQTLRRREKIIAQFHAIRDKLVILVDECHRNTATPIVQAIGPRYTVGFSATPHFKWAKHLPVLYKSLIHGPQIKALIPEYLCHYKHIIRTGANLAELELKGNEYTEASQERVFGSKRMYDGVFEDLPLHTNGKTVIYVASIRQCEEMYTKLQAQGYKVCRYHSELPNSSYELAKFTDTHAADICVSVSSLTMGWDYPPIDLIVLWRATTSLPLYLQMCGRGGRPLSVERALNEYGLHEYNKQQFTVLDYGGNYERFGPWDMDRDWNELWQDPKNKRKIGTYAGVAGSKLCPICQALIPQAAVTCYNCGYMYPESEVRLIQGQLLEVQNTLNSLKERKVGDLSAPELANYAKLHNKKAFAMRIARGREQAMPGFLEQYAEAMGYDRRWINHQRELINQSDDKITFFNMVIK